MGLAAILASSVIMVTCAVTGTVQASTHAGGVLAEVGVVHGGTLDVVDEVSGRAVVVARGPYYGVLGSAIGTPGFAADGAWVAYLETTSNGSTSVHVVSSSGAHAITVAGGQGYAWSPVREELAVSLPGSSLAVLTAGGGSARTILSRAGYCQQPAGWTADGSRVLTWQDADCSASIAADGLTLDAVPVAGGRAVSLGTTLADPSWVLPVSGTRVLVNSGGDRIVADHKVLRSCDAATGACTAFLLPAGITSLDPALAAAAHELFEVRVPQSVQASDFVPHGTLWAGTLSGGGEHQLTAAGTGVADPVPSADDSMVTFVRMTSTTTATVDVLNVRTGQVRVLAPVDDADYYGEFTASGVLAVRV